LSIDGFNIKGVMLPASTFDFDGSHNSFGMARKRLKLPQKVAGSQSDFQWWASIECVMTQPPERESVLPGQGNGGQRLALARPINSTQTVQSTMLQAGTARAQPAPAGRQCIDALPSIFAHHRRDRINYRTAGGNARLPGA
jgi:hypothetical protein